MNGRMYDPVLGRFLSPDNFVQDPYNSQSYNRYGYVLNNPLMYTDKSGEFWILIPIIVGAYFGGAQANGSFNPLKWDYNNPSTYVGILGGGLIGGVSFGIGSAISGVTSTALASVGINGGFWGGAISGLTSGIAGGGFSGGFMSMLPGGSGNFIKDSLIGASIGGFAGFGIGGLVGYFTTPKGMNPMNGNHLSEEAVVGKSNGVQLNQTTPNPEQISSNLQGIERSSNSSNSVSILESKYTLSNSIDNNLPNIQRQPFTPQDVIKAVKGDNYNLINNGTHADIIMTETDFASLIDDFAKYEVRSINPGITEKVYNFQSMGTGAMRGYVDGSTRFYWFSLGSSYKFKIYVYK
jgi:hypothetical protein